VVAAAVRSGGDAISVTSVALSAGGEPKEVVAAAVAYAPEQSIAIVSVAVSAGVTQDDAWAASATGLEQSEKLAKKEGVPSPS